VGRWKRFRQLSWPARGYLLEAALVLPIVRLGLRVFSFRKFQVVLQHLAPRIGASRSSAAEVERARLVARMLRALQTHGAVQATCLPESLALWWMLRRRRLPAELCLGARKDAQVFEAHAWVELAGAVLNDTDDVHQRFAPFDRSVSSVQAGLP
jgi:hypothetical protein